MLKRIKIRVDIFYENVIEVSKFVYVLKETYEELLDIFYTRAYDKIKCGLWYIAFMGYENEAVKKRGGYLIKIWKCAGSFFFSVLYRVRGNYRNRGFEVVPFLLAVWCQKFPKKLEYRSVLRREWI